MSTVPATLDEQFTPAQRLLRERLDRLLATLAPPLRADVTRALSAPGKLLWQEASQSGRLAGVWGLLTLSVAWQVSDDINPRLATSVAIAVELYICALDLLDDIEDSDRTPTLEELGVARTLSAATTLLFLTQQVLLETACYLAPEQVLRLLEALSATSLTATTGQHLDILTEERAVSSLSAQECLDILAAKSGSLMSLACRLGALCAGADPALCEQWAELGKLLGISHQLDNDSHDGHDLILAACEFSPAPTRNGAERGTHYKKKTLPVVLAVQIYEQRCRGRSHPWAEEERQRSRGMAVQEALVITSARALLYLQRVRDAVRQFESARPLSPALRRLLGM